VVAASRTEERSSFYHVSREREGKGREYDAEEVNDATKVGEADGGRARRRVKSSLHKMIRDNLCSPRCLPHPLRRSDFRPIKSPRWRRGGGEANLFERSQRVALRAFEFHAKFGQFRRACTLFVRPAPFYHRAYGWFHCFFLPHSLLPSALPRRRYRRGVVSHGDRDPDRPWTSDLAPRRERIIGVRCGRGRRGGR